MVVAGYLLCSTNLRVIDSHDSSRSNNILCLPNGPPTRGFLNPSILRERAELVFKLVKQRMSNLVIVNSALSEFDMIQAGVEVAEKYADNVMVIPPLLARMTYAIEPLANFRNPPAKEVILVVTITKPFVDFVILRRDANFELYIESCENYQPNQCREMFAQYYEDYYPDSTIFVVQKSLIYVADQLKHDFQPLNCFVKPFEKWDYVLLFGGMLRAVNYDVGFDQRYQIANFSSGYETTIENHHNITRKRHVLLPERTPLPCYIRGYNGPPQRIKIFYFNQYYQISNDLVLRTRQTTNLMISATGSADQIIGYVDERGIPYAKPPKIPLESRKIESHKAAEYSKEEPGAVVTSYVLSIDLAVGSILEYDPLSGNKKLVEHAFDPNLPSSSKANPYENLYSILLTKAISALNILTTHEIFNEGKDIFISLCNNVSYIPHIKAKLSY
uniref:Uncharacterized protein n=1 Tax=Panagrolaimus sp. PS1159 TaxID=55785 RepID=A0AC35EVR0_9BILA